MIEDASGLDAFATAGGFVQPLITETLDAVGYTLLQSAHHLGLAVWTVHTRLMFANVLGMCPSLSHLLSEL